MDNLKEILDSLNPKAQKKKQTKMKDVFTNPKEPNKIIKIMSKSSGY